jgi:hypothetical protein
MWGLFLGASKIDLPSTLSLATETISSIDRPMVRRASNG